ncbi:low specificity L-threonine aldolase [Carboxylicivirga sp. A043]|uniref:threonine aldolase family protein n=1 Tax=Carboxylicivirga litoralis TaxID=2816963 RepID=UPI0021CB818A|nr:low specificity L-threonine aldolase [Carboxylicivirga sp. A043]MCU4158109.1 low specificity L-threonine aldolase [Carboxylicivirga sp. A043]
MKQLRGFASDNNASVHPVIMEAIANANIGHAVGYGDDTITEQAQQVFKQCFGQQTQTFFVYNGTGANVIAIQALTQSFNAVVCANTAHINVDECGAPEKLSGCKLLPIDTDNGKVTVEQIERYMHGFGFEHHAQPKVVSITQATELGTIYAIEEIKAIADYVHSLGLYLHMDGARIANAAAALGCSLADISINAGVDVLSFGGTKNGLMFGEAIVFADAKLAESVKYIRKQSTQLHSKMRFISAQFVRLLEDDLWLRNANHANNMARLLGEKVAAIDGVELTQRVDSNGVFAIIPKDIIEPLQQEFFFYVWDEYRSEVRWMTSFDTTEEDIEQFVSSLQKLQK